MCLVVYQVMDKSVALISESKSAVQDPSVPNKQQRLAQAAKAVSQALNQVVNCLPGQIEFDHAIKAIAEASRKLQSGKVRRGDHKILLTCLLVAVAWM